MDLEIISAPEFGRSLKGIGLNLLVRDVLATCDFLSAVFGLTSFQKSRDFAIVSYGTQLFQLHADAAYHGNPLAGLLPDTPPRGAGIEIRLYDSDPDRAVRQARAYCNDIVILQQAQDKPHGLREAYILCQNGYAWVPSRPLRAGG